MNHVILGITGASGGPYARRLAQCLTERDLHLHVVVSPFGRELLAQEAGIQKLTPDALAPQHPERITIHKHNDVGAPIASGSFLTHGMIICPCSSHTLAAVATGLGDNLITRAAMVTLKESRRLVVVPREAPLGLIEIENMARLARAGALICPASPGFYLHPKTIDDLVDFVVGRVLDLLGLEHELDTRWDPSRHRGAPK